MPPPEQLLTETGHLHPRVQALFRAAWAYESHQLARTRWLPARRIPLLAWALRKQGFAAITLGRHIYYVEEQLADHDFADWFDLVAHEEVHRAQIGRRGMWGFYVRYLLLSLRTGYRNHPDEIEARATRARHLLEYHGAAGLSVRHLLAEGRLESEYRQALLLRLGFDWRERHGPRFSV